MEDVGKKEKKKDSFSPASAHSNICRDFGRTMSDFSSIENAEVQRSASTEYSPYKAGAGADGTAPPPQKPAAKSSLAGVKSSISRELSSHKRAISALGASLTSGILGGSLGGGSAPYEDFLTSPEWVKRHRPHRVEQSGDAAPSARTRFDS